MAAVLALILALQVAPAPGNAQAAAGWQAIRAGAADDAARDFAEALRLGSTDALTYLGAGTAAVMRGKTDEAQEQLNAALKVQPSLTAASLLLGEVLYRNADLDGAIGVYEQALTFAPNDRRLSSRLEAWRHEASVQGAFSTRIANHFTILFEGPPDQPAAAKIADMLESIYWQVGEAMGAYPANILTVVLYSREEFRDVTQSPSWAGGMYDGRIRVPIAGRISERELRRVLTHEFTHAVIYSLAPRGVPQWLNEGLAVYMEQGGTGAPAPASNAAPLPLNTLEGSFERLDPDQARAAYATSAAAVRALIDRGGPMVIYNLLTDLGAGMPFDQAFERNALVSYAEFARTLR